jgi:hypothetical protein
LVKSQREVILNNQEMNQINELKMNHILLFIFFKKKFEKANLKY